MRWIVSLSVIVAACGGPQAPSHNGYKPKEAAPWKKAKALKFDDKMEAKAEGDVSYPDMRRARWFQLDLPSSGQLSLTLEINPPGEAVNDNFDLGMEVLDPGNRVIAKSDLESEDAHELNKKKTLPDLVAGKYLVHVYLQGRMDTAEFALRAVFKPSAAAEVKTNFPAEVPFVPSLAMVPIQDDTPRRPTPPPRPPRRGDPPTPTPTATKTPPPSTASVVARILSVQVGSGGCQIVIGRGKTTGASDGMHGKIQGIAATYTINNCNDRTCSALVAATPDQIKNSDGNVTLTQ